MSLTAYIRRRRARPPRSALRSPERVLAGRVVRHVNRTYPSVECTNAGLFSGEWRAKTPHGWIPLGDLAERFGPPQKQES